MAQVIGLVLQRDASLVWLDGREAGTEANRLGLAVSGTIGILERAAEKGMRILEAAFAGLTAMSYRIDRHDLEQTLHRGKCRPQDMKP